MFTQAGHNVLMGAGTKIHLGPNDEPATLEWTGSEMIVTADDAVIAGKNRPEFWLNGRIDGVIDFRAGSFMTGYSASAAMHCQDGSPMGIIDSGVAVTGTFTNPSIHANSYVFTTHTNSGTTYTQPLAYRVFVHNIQEGSFDWSVYDHATALAPGTPPVAASYICYWVMTPIPNP